MSTKIVYLAQPIDRALYHDSGWQDALPNIVGTLHEHGYYVYQPARAWNVGDRPTVADYRIEQVNDRALGLADLVVAVLPAEIPTIGVPMEIERAIGYGIPVVAIVTHPGVSFALERPGIRQVRRVSDLRDAIDWAETARHLQATADHLYSPIQVVLADGHDLPFRAYADDAGIDLTTIGEHIIYPGNFVDVHTQVDAVQLPPGYWGMITGRSSTLRQHGLHVPVAVIDPGWRGPLFVGVWNLGRAPVTIRPGQRLGQLILVPNTPAPIAAVEKVDDAPRGTQGFGSSG